MATEPSHNQSAVVFEFVRAALDGADAALASDLSARFFHVGVKLVDGDLEPTNGEWIADRYLMLRCRPLHIFELLHLLLACAHHEGAGWQRHHFWAMFAIAEGFPRSRVQ